MPCSRIARLNIVTMAVVPKAIYRYKIFIKTAITLFPEKLIFKFIWNCMGS